MRFGLRAILLIVAIVMFVLAVILDENAFDLMALGLAALAGSLLVDDLGLDRALDRGGHRADRSWHRDSGEAASGSDPWRSVPPHC